MPKQNILHFDFLRNKYGQELLLDVGRMESLQNFVLSDTPHVLSFYDIMFLEHGSGTFSLDGVAYTLEPGRIVFTSPGQVRQWNAKGEVAGYTLFFEEDFITSFFNDPLFLSRFQFFNNAGQPSGILAPASGFQQHQQTIQAIEQEIKQLQNDSPHMLRALLYQLLISLNRLYAQQHSTNADTEGNHVVYTFRKLLEQHYQQKHQVQEYAQLLHTTPAHLNSITQRYFGATASTLIKNRLLLEAKRQLLYTSKTVAEIAYSLNFSDTANFNRFFRTQVGQSPKIYRSQV
ncbi:helix-turn-helix domain-containing protein [Pontibacter cellulosilyticus]|uniref:Helix-turn-helix domain-containing protein n=1 Tax=Pontibacter cellulosilyticus TaxID=1720253 RepID=A0A923NA02_9BACT|nr:AraC family transcriptional regulator [Pontibacter cellulosilyticus]MBC5994939.1 helix-turn-helix domain-containing protein [Pontibacter cellulosilyticus]